MRLIDSEKTLNGKKLFYEIVENGYNIYLGNGSTPWITQPAPYDKLYLPDGTHEENALAQIEELCNPTEPEPSAEEQLRADVDYIAAMTGITL